MTPPLLPHERRIRLGAAGLFLLGIALVAWIDPRSRLPFPAVPCGFRTLTGLPCPFCGGTRAAHALLHGDLAGAAHLNPLAYPALALALAVAAVLLIEVIRRQRIVDWERSIHRIARFAPLIAALVVAWWIPHILLAIRTPKPELVDLKNPIAACLKQALESPAAGNGTNAR